MQILKINLENCYGIAKLDHEFNFNSGKAKIIYAPNGCMKSSFAKTLSSIAKGEQPKDEIFSDRVSKYQITLGTIDIDPKQILVVEPYSETYSSRERMSTLLVNKELKNRYIEILDSIEKKKTELLKTIKETSGSTNAESEINSLFHKKTIFESIELITVEVNNNDFLQPNFKYGDIINSKVEDFLNTNSGLIEDYIVKYSELVNGSNFFEKGIFGTENASGVKKIINR